MQKKNLVSLVMGTIGGILLAIGMCMCLVSRWAAFTQGVVFSAAGVIALLSMLIVRRRMAGKPAVSLSVKAAISVLLGMIGTLFLGISMCMVMLWSMLAAGVLVGLVGIVLLLCVIPLVRGLK